LPLTSIIIATPRPINPQQQNGSEISAAKPPSSA